MGIFSRQSSSSQTQVNSDGDIYVFVHASSLNKSAVVKWSLVVLDRDGSLGGSGRTSDEQQIQQPQQRKKSFLSLSSRRNSKSTDTSVPSPQIQIANSLKPPVLQEFAFSAGNLNITQHHAIRSPSTSNSSLDPDLETILLQFLLPRPTINPSDLPNSSLQSQSLGTQVEQTLRRLSSSNPYFFHFSGSPSEASLWLKFALAALQNERFLSPASAGLNVEKFMDFAQNALTGFEGEILQRQDMYSEMDGDEGEERDEVAVDGVMNVDSGLGAKFGLGACHVKFIDYAACMRENERLRVMLGYRR